MDKLWAYPWMAAFLTVFIAYQGLVATTLVRLAGSLTVSATLFGAVYLLLHGLVRVALDWAVLNKLKFHRNSPELMLALQRVLTDPSEDTLLAMPQVFIGVHWSTVFAETWHFIAPMLAMQERFGNSHVTRPMFFQHHGQKAVDAWRSVWEGRDAVVVTGQGSRFDLVPALFDNLGSVMEVSSTPTDAFFDLDRLIGGIEDTGRDLVLLSLGPAATIAADLLAARGIQALDVGHLSASYKNVLLGTPLPEHLPPIRDC
jgi:Glycosyltransferase GT-D fold